MFYVIDTICFVLQICIKNSYDYLSWDRFTCVYGIIMDNRKLDIETM